MYIGLISDTHGVFSKEFRKFLEPVDEIWHAGDFGGGMELAEEIARFKPLLGVAGNCDNHEPSVATGETILPVNSPSFISKPY